MSNPNTHCEHCGVALTPENNTKLHWMCNDCVDARESYRDSLTPIQIKLTEGQHAVFEALRIKTGEKKTAFLRRLLTQEAENHGLIFPQDVPSNDIKNARAKRWPKE
jgi:hypothetical protein